MGVSVQMDSFVYQIGLGANLSDRGRKPAETLVRALAGVAEAGVKIRAVSRFYRTPAYPLGSGPDFVNACATLETALAPQELLALLHRIEAELGRTRTHRWEARKVDLDLLAAGDLILPDAEVQARWRVLAPERQAVEAPEVLILPHPRLQDRSFVLIPLADIAPGWRHPATGRTAAEMAAALPEAEKAQIRPVFAANSAE